MLGFKSGFTCEASSKFLNLSGLWFFHQQNGLHTIPACPPQRLDYGIALKTVKGLALINPLLSLFTLARLCPHRVA